MTEIGRIALIVALAIGVYSAVAAVIAARRDLPDLMTSARRGVLVVAGLVTIAAD